MGSNVFLPKVGDVVVFGEPYSSYGCISLSSREDDPLTDRVLFDTANTVFLVVDSLPIRDTCARFKLLASTRHVCYAALYVEGDNFFKKVA